LKAQCEENLSSPIPIDIETIQSDTMIMKASIYSVAFTLAKGGKRSRAAYSGKITTF